jgi:hypothetical protein
MRYAIWPLMAALCGYSALAEDEYCPLTVGQERTMAVTISMPDGSVIAGTAHRKIEGNAEKDGKAYFRCRTWFEGMPFKEGSTKLIRKDEKAVYSIDERDAGAVEHVSVVLPLKVGSTWERIVRGMAVTDTVIQREAIDISGKTYKNCYHIQSIWSDGRFTKDAWEAPNVGTVKEQTAYADGLRFTYTLQDFKPGK